jgi:hypothetical protein
MPRVLQPWQLFVAILAGWVNEHQQAAIVSSGHLGQHIAWASLLSLFESFSRLTLEG